jgi:hypothetical protein
MMHEIVCVNCGIVIRWQPTLVEGRPYCCLGCTRGGPCECDYDNLPEPGAMHAMAPRQPEMRSIPGQETD